MSELAAIHISQRLSYLSTVWNAGRLIFCVREGYRNYPAAMAARLTHNELIKVKPRSGFEPEWNRSAGDCVAAPPPWQ